MEQSRKKPHTGTHAALVSLCGGTCYWRDCRERVIKEVEGQYVMNLQIAHIRAAEPNGPRYDDGPPISDEDRRAFTNLILLCHPHHTLVDKVEPEKYSVETLHKWKRERETPGQNALRALREVTEEGLQALIGEAFAERGKRIESTLVRLERHDQAAAAVLQGLVDELAEVRRNGPQLDPDVASQLSKAANTLGKLNLPDVANDLRNAAKDLNFLNPDAILTMIEQLRAATKAAAAEYRRLQQYM